MMRICTPKEEETDALTLEIESPSSYSFRSICSNSHSNTPRSHGVTSSYLLSPSDTLSGSIEGITSLYTPSLDEKDDGNTFPDTTNIEIIGAVEPHKQNTSETDTLLSHGYTRCKYIADTLQGETFLARHCDLGQVVIKQTRKDLYARGVTITKEGEVIKIDEDIVLEAEMMRNFMLNSPPSSLIKFYEFFQDSENYYFVMENGGRDFFDFVVDCHELIRCGKLQMKEWRKQCRFMFAQMIECIEWLHNEMNHCHLDISLENMLISNQVQFDEASGTFSNCYIKFIDFGLAQSFNLNTNPSYLCNKFVGKPHYKCPQIYAQKESFCANKADVWSLGICLFMMVVGAPPYDKACNKDIGFRFIEKKQISKLLFSWNRIKFVTPNLYDLIARMLSCDEQDRITMDEIIRHDWCKAHFAKKLSSSSNGRNHTD